jgi:cell division protein ZapE
MTGLPKHSGPVLRSYLQRITQHEIERDLAQQDAVVRLDTLARALSAYRTRRRGIFSIFGGGKSASAAPKGLYIHGGVGRGKTMLMDLFFEQVDFAPKARLHFHEFMAEAHEQIRLARKEVPGDPIPLAAAHIAERAGLLCFDELHVTDIADAMILGRLFRVLFARNVVVVATSNALPQDLYRDGLNRQLFLPFIDLIEDHMTVYELDSEKDFRLAKLAGRQLYFAPADERARAQLDEHWLRLTGVAEPASQVLTVKGRALVVPKAAMGVARFEFSDLCECPLGSIDYLQIARSFHTLLIDAIPVLTPDKRNEARRFINLIDALYDNKVGLIASAAAEPDALYLHGEGANLFERTVSRLMEMRTEEYLEARNRRAENSATL